MRYPENTIFFWISICFLFFIFFLSDNGDRKSVEGQSVSDPLREVLYHDEDGNSIILTDVPSGDQKSVTVMCDDHPDYGLIELYPKVEVKKYGFSTYKKMEESFEIPSGFISPYGIYRYSKRHFVCPVDSKIYVIKTLQYPY